MPAGHTALSWGSALTSSTRLTTPVFSLPQREASCCGTGLSDTSVHSPVACSLVPSLTHASSPTVPFRNFLLGSVVVASPVTVVEMYCKRLIAVAHAWLFGAGAERSLG